MIDENVTRAFNNFLKRISSINDDWYDEIELQLLCADIFGKTGTLICCRVELDHKSIYDVGFENLTQTTRKKLQGDLNIKRLMESPEFTTHPIRVGRDLLVGNSSVWLIRYTRFDKNPSFFFGYISNVKFICTFNTSERNIDSALLREGRLRVMYEFKKLSLDKTRAFIPNATEPMTLAKIFKAKKTFRQEMKEKKVGYL